MLSYIGDTIDRHENYGYIHQIPTRTHLALGNFIRSMDLPSLFLVEEKKDSFENTSKTLQFIQSE